MGGVVTIVIIVAIVVRMVGYAGLSARALVGGIHTRRVGSLCTGLFYFLLSASSVRYPFRVFTDATN